MLLLADTTFAEETWIMVVKSIVIFAVIFGILPLLTVLERKLIGRFQHRYGPNRVGPFGLLQPLADVGKLVSQASFPARDPAAADGPGAKADRPLPAPLRAEPRRPLRPPAAARRRRQARLQGVLPSSGSCRC